MVAASDYEVVAAEGVGPNCEAELGGEAEQWAVQGVVLYARLREIWNPVCGRWADLVVRSLTIASILERICLGWSGWLGVGGLVMISTLGAIRGFIGVVALVYQRTAI
jgi:hypothetical protein